MTPKNHRLWNFRGLNSPPRSVVQNSRLEGELKIEEMLLNKFKMKFHGKLLLRQIHFKKFVLSLKGSPASMSDSIKMAF